MREPVQYTSIHMHRVVGREGGREIEGREGRGGKDRKERQGSKVRTKGDEKDHKKAECMHKHKHTQWTPHSTLYIHSVLYIVAYTHV